MIVSCEREKVNEYRVGDRKSFEKEPENVCTDSHKVVGTK